MNKPIVRKGALCRHCKLAHYEIFEGSDKPLKCVRCGKNKNHINDKGDKK